MWVRFPPLLQKMHSIQSSGAIGSADKIRDSIIESENWKVIRIKWKHKDYNYMHLQIDDFLEKYIIANVV